MLNLLNLINISAIQSVITTYGYAILFPLAAFEGPIVSLVAGFLVYSGYFNFFPAYLILILGDLIPDIIYYYVGRFGKKKNVIEKYGHKLKVIHENFDIVGKLWKEHPRKTMFFSKLAYGLSTPFLISAGLIDMPLKKFISLALPVTILQYGVIMAIGYFLGHSYTYAAGYIKYANIIFALVLVTFLIIYILLNRYARKQLEKDAEQKK